MNSVFLYDVTARDGLQSAGKTFTLQQRVQLVKGLAEAGFPYVEAGSFVRHDLVPAMKGTEKVIENCGEYINCLGCLVPNSHGLENALASGVGKVGLLAAVSDSFSRANLCCSSHYSLEKVHQLAETSKRQGLHVRLYLSTAFSCPREGKIPLGRLLDFIGEINMDLIDVLLISDTCGTASPVEVERMCSLLPEVVEEKKIGFHFHDNHGFAIVNAWVAFKLGCRHFDCALGAVGGCPFAEINGPNLDSLRLIRMLRLSGVKNLPDERRLQDLSDWFTSLLSC